LLSSVSAADMSGLFFEKNTVARNTKVSGLRGDFKESAVPQADRLTLHDVNTRRLDLNSFKSDRVNSLTASGGLT